MRSYLDKAPKIVRRGGFFCPVLSEESEYRKYCFQPVYDNGVVTVTRILRCGKHIGSYSDTVGSAHLMRGYENLEHIVVKALKWQIEQKELSKKEKTR